MGIFSEMIRGIVAEELKAMAAEGAGETDPKGGETDPKGGETDPKGGETDPKGGETDPKGGETDPKAKATDPEKKKETTSDPELRAVLRKELREYMASELTGEEVEGDMPTAEEALCSILGLGEKEKE
jgi:hypothetical protein